MSLEDQTASGLALRMMDADHDRSVGMFCGEPGGAGMPLDRGPVHGEAVEREAFVPQRTKHEVLNGVLRAANRGKANQRFGEFGLLGEAFLDRRDDPLTQIMIDHHASVFLLAGKPARSSYSCTFRPCVLLHFGRPFGSDRADPDILAAGTMSPARRRHAACVPWLGGG